MAIYSYKESAIDDTIQTPDDVGVDLDQIEEDIAGKDGIEAHRDEIEYADEEGVGDPLEECATLIYESTYNMNQILKCLQIHDLHEASRGREMILEAVDIAGFFDKIYDALVIAFRKITEVFAKVRADMRAKNTFFDNWVKKNAEHVKDGEHRYEGTIKGYPSLMEKNWMSMKIPSQTIGKDISSFKDMATIGTYLRTADNGVEAMLKGMYKELFGKSSDSVKMSDFEAGFKELYFGSANMEKSTLNVSADKVLEILKDTNCIKFIEGQYADVKKTYQNMMDMIKTAKREAMAKADDIEHAKDIKAIVAQINKKISAAQNVTSCSYKLAVASVRTRKLTAFSIAKAYASKSEVKKEKKVESKQESANLFDTIAFA